MSTFPSVLTSYTDPLPTNRLNSPSHSSIESAQNSGIKQLEAVIGVAGANSVVGTYEYLVKSPASDGGGHVQTAVLGGTGQITFNKGDILVATGPSVLSKMAVGSDGQVLQSNSGFATGMFWSSVVANKVNLNTASVVLGNTQTASVMYATSILGSVLGTNNAVRFTGVIQKFLAVNSDFEISATYGNNTLISFGIAKPGGSNLNGNNFGTLEGILAGDGATNKQQFYLRTIIGTNNMGGGAGSSVITAYGFSVGNSSVESTAPQDFIIKGRYPSSNGSNTLTTGIFEVDKIQ